MKINRNRIISAITLLCVFSASDLVSSEARQTDISSALQPVPQAPKAGDSKQLDALRKEQAEQIEDAELKEQHALFEDFTTKLRDDQECVICQSPFITKDPTTNMRLLTAGIQLPCCGKFIHGQCQKQWTEKDSQNQNRCVHCKQPFTGEQVAVWKDDNGLFLKTREEATVGRQLSRMLMALPHEQRSKLLLLFTHALSRQQKTYVLNVAASVIGNDDNAIIARAVGELKHSKNSNLAQLVLNISENLRNPKPDTWFAKQAFNSLIPSKDTLIRSALFLLAMKYKHKLDRFEDQSVSVTIAKILFAHALSGSWEKFYTIIKDREKYFNFLSTNIGRAAIDTLYPQSFWLNLSEYTRYPFVSHIKSFGVGFLLNLLLFTRIVEEAPVTP